MEQWNNGTRSFKSISLMLKVARKSK
jgi:hypothetical protein